MVLRVQTPTVQRLKPTRTVNFTFKKHTADFTSFSQKNQCFARTHQIQYCQDTPHAQEPASTLKCLSLCRPNCHLSRAMLFISTPASKQATPFLPLKGSTYILANKINSVDQGRESNAGQLTHALWTQV